MSVAEADALLYLTGHSRAELERALRIPALPPGWRSSFQALLQQGLHEGQAMGNPGLSLVGPAPAWTGFRPHAGVADRPGECQRVFSRPSVR